MTREKRFTIEAVTPSGNELLRTHWAKRKANRVVLANEAFVAARDAGVPVAGPQEFRELVIYSFRPRLLDYDNLVGGAKGLLDALREAKVIWQDSPKFLRVEYIQTVETRRPRTEIVVRIGARP